MPEESTISVTNYESVSHILGCNPSPLTLNGTNTFIVGSGTKRILIDVGNGNAQYSENLRVFLAREGVQISDIIISHSHYEADRVCDHSGGLLSVLSLLSSLQPAQKPCVYKFLNSDYDRVTPNLVYYQKLYHGQIFEIEGATLEVIHTPGHTPDSICLFIREKRALFTGDLIIGRGTATFADFKQLLSSLTLIADYNPLILYTGKGPMIDSGAVEKILQVRQHRLDREEQIFQLVQKNPGISLAELTKIIYHRYDSSLFGIASEGIKLHLSHLALLGKVSQESDGWIPNA